MLASTFGQAAWRRHENRLQPSRTALQAGTRIVGACGYGRAGGAATGSEMGLASVEEEGSENGSLFLRVLGPTTLERAGTPLPIGGPRQREVLVRLALAEGRLVTVEQLVEDIWGDAPSTILTTLHSYVSRLRTSLGAGRLRREGPGYVLDLAAEEVDFRLFERLAREGCDLAPTDPAAGLALIDEALALWRGPAYADVRDMAVAAAAGVRLDELRFGAKEARFDAMLALGRHVAAVAELERIVDEHPLRERFTAQLMLALYRAGRQADALRAYERMRRHLLDELGLDPSPDLAKLESSILAHDPSLAAPGGDAIGAPAAPASPTSPAAPAVTKGPATTGAPLAGSLIGTAAAPGRSPVQLPPPAVRHGSRPFVGRAAALDSLRAAWRTALDGKQNFVVIEGEAGAGKSRLAARFAAEAHEHGAIVLWGRATTEAIVPYEALVEALRTVLRTVSPEARRRVVEGREGLSMLLPFLAELEIPIEPSSPKPELGTDRYVLYETVAELLDAESSAWPILFVLDDLQWADALSLRLLHHLLRHERAARLLAVCTVRTVPPTPNADLDWLLNELHRDGLLSRISLDGLAEDEIAELLAHTADGAPRARARDIHRATRGNPFFVTELLEHGNGASLPTSVRDALGARLDRLPVPAGRLLSVAAAAGGLISLPVLAWATGLARDDLLDAIDATLDAGLLSEEPSTGSLIFRHALVQQVVLERLSRSRLSTLHLTLADALTALGSSKIELARHLHEAGALAEPERTVGAMVAAGREALDVLAYEEGEQWAQRALAIRDVSGALRCEALLLSSDAHRALGDRHAARDAAAAAADEARTTGDPVLLARAAEALALVRAGLGFDFGTTDERLDTLLEEALAGLPAGEVDHRARLLGASLSNAAAEGDLLALRGLSDRALALAGAHEHPALVATAHLSARMAGWRVDSLEERLATDRAALEAADRAGNPHLQLSTLLYGIADLTEAGCVTEAEEWFGRFRELAASVRQPAYDAFVGFIDATMRLMRGDYEGSAKLADEALVRGLQSHGVNAEQAWSGQAFIRAWDQGQLGNLVELAEQAAARPPYLPIWRVALAAALVANGRPEEARPALEELVTDDGLQHNPDSLWLVAGGLLVEIARELGDAHRAAILLRELEPYVGRITMSGLGRASLGPVARFAGIAAHVAGDLDRADLLLTMAAAQSREIGAVPHEARALYDRAAVLAERDGPGDADEASRLRERALALAEPIGLVLGGLGAPSRRA